MGILNSYDQALYTNATSYKNGTRMLKSKSGNATKVFPLTSNTSASQYCRARFNCNGTKAYLATATTGTYHGTETYNTTSQQNTTMTETKTSTVPGQVLFQATTYNTTAAISRLFSTSFATSTNSKYIYTTTYSKSVHASASTTTSNTNDKNLVVGANARGTGSAAARTSARNRATATAMSRSTYFKASNIWDPILTNNEYTMNSYVNSTQQKASVYTRQTSRGAVGAATTIGSSLTSSAYTTKNDGDPGGKYDASVSVVFTWTYTYKASITTGAYNSAVSKQVSTLLSSESIRMANNEGNVPSAESVTTTSETTSFYLADTTPQGVAAFTLGNKYTNGQLSTNSASTKSTAATTGQSNATTLTYATYTLHRSSTTSSKRSSEYSSWWSTSYKHNLLTTQSSSNTYTETYASTTPSAEYRQTRTTATLTSTNHNINM